MTPQGADGVEYLMVAVDTNTLMDFLDNEEADWKLQQLFDESFCHWGKLQLATVVVGHIEQFLKYLKIIHQYRNAMNLCHLFFSHWLLQRTDILVETGGIK